MWFWSFTSFLRASWVPYFVPMVLSWCTPFKYFHAFTVKLYYCLFFFFNFMRAWPHKHWACAVPFPRLPFSSWQVQLYSGMLHACFASQTSIEFVSCSLKYLKFARFGIFGIVLVCVLCLTNIGFVQCYDSTPFSFHPLLYLALPLFFVCFASQTWSLCSTIVSAPLNLHALLYSAMFLHSCFASQKLEFSVARTLSYQIWSRWPIVGCWPFDLALLERVVLVVLESFCS